MIERIGEKKENKMIVVKGKGFVLKTYLIIALLFVSLGISACGYGFEEIRQMEQYEEQGETNALNYIKNKYGFDATVVSADCCNGEFATVLSSVFVTMEYKGKLFTVYIDGDKKTTEGCDNYQFEEIAAALQEEVYTVTNIPMEDFFLCYGQYEQTMEESRNGLISAYFDGKNLMEVVRSAHAPSAVVVSYLNQDIRTVDVETLKKRTGIDCYLLVDYGSRENYECIKNPYYTLDGLGIIKSMPYISEYRVIGSNEDTYVNCEKQVIDNILIITQKQGEKVSLIAENEERSDLGDKITTEQMLEYIYQKDFVDEGKVLAENADVNQEKQVSETYILSTESQQIYIYIPVEQLDAEGVDVEDLYIHVYDNLATINTSTWITDDEKYIGVKLYPKGEKIMFEVIALLDK